MNDIIEAAIPLESVPYDPIVNETGDISSMTAEQYLSWVRDQAASMPLVKRCNIDMTEYNKNQTKYMPEIDEIPVCSDELLPDRDWKNDIIADFSNLRQLLSDLAMEEKYRERKICIPQLKDKEAWHRFCLANEIDIEEKKNTDSNNINDVIDDNSSQLDETSREADREILRNKKLKLARKIGLDININDHDNTMNEENENIDNHNENEINQDNNDNDDDDDDDDDGTSEALAVASAVANAKNMLKWQGVENVIPTASLLLQIDQVVTQKLLAYHAEWLEERSLSIARGKWIYSILAKIDKPLHQDIAAFIRQIYRRCSILRSNLDVTSESLEEDLAILNILIAITGFYFGQSETNETKIQTINISENYDDNEYDDNDDYIDDDYYGSYNINQQEEEYNETEVYLLQKNDDIEEGEYVEEIVT